MIGKRNATWNDGGHMNKRQSRGPSGNFRSSNNSSVGVDHKPHPSNLGNINKTPQRNFQNRNQNRGRNNNGSNNNNANQQQARRKVNNTTNNQRVSINRLS